MKVVHRIVPALLLALAAATAAKAETVELRSKLLDRVSDLRQATLEGNYRAVINLMPPRVIDVFAASGGVSPAVLKDALVNGTEDVMAQVTVLENVMMTGRTSFYTVSDELLFAVVPMRFVIQVNDGPKVESDEQQIAVYEHPQWYLMRVANSDHSDALSLAYPVIVGTSFESVLNQIAHQTN